VDGGCRLGDPDVSVEVKMRKTKKDFVGAIKSRKARSSLIIPQ
jgi:hypothetical protein